MMERSQVEKISKALADETRLMIFEAISAKDHVNCSELVAMRGVTPATVSHHLRVLTEAGLVECKREGQFVCSRVVPEAIEEFARTLTRIARGGRPTRKKA
jgi:ArsR family transcriptional regulator, arsenate/arsenite/antimonite-responsive transcriptional repressor